jgi:hypothetical protein
LLVNPAVLAMVMLTNTDPAVRLLTVQLYCTELAGSCCHNAAEGAPTPSPVVPLLLLPLPMLLLLGRQMLPGSFTQVSKIPQSDAIRSRWKDSTTAGGPAIKAG